MISTHTPLAGRDSKMFDSHIVSHISTHTPLAGRDPYKSNIELWEEISTHTPLAGRDISAVRHLAVCNHFYSHAPRGA